jgi:hypothetical protein
MLGVRFVLALYVLTITAGLVLYAIVGLTHG